MKTAEAVVLAAGRGTRMNSAKPTALHEVAGRPVIDWMLTALEGCMQVPPVIVDSAAGKIAAHVGGRARIAMQEEPRGEVDALRTALGKINGDGLVLVLFGNLPLLETAYLEAVVGAAERDGAALLVSADEETSEMNACGVYCFEGALLRKALEACALEDELSACLQAMREQGTEAHELLVGQASLPAVVDRKSLSLCEALTNAAIVERHLESGVTMIDPNSVHIGADVTIGRDTVLWPNVALTGKTAIGEGCVIKSGCQLNDTRVGNDCTFTYVFANGAEVGNRVTAGPFVNLRPDTRIADGCKIGDFVEVKNSNVGEGTKLPHLSYIGDADVGSGVNVGCGCVFVNYDGYAKHRTTVGNDVFLGCQTNLVAPVTVGDGAYTAAGSTITHDVPAGAMAFARARQSNKEGYVEKFRSLKKK